MLLFTVRMTKDKISHTSLHLGSPAWSQCWSTVSLLVGSLLSQQLPSPGLSALLLARIPWFSYWWKQKGARKGSLLPVEMGDTGSVFMHAGREKTLTQNPSVLVLVWYVAWVVEWVPRM